ncbi:unnamed protein product [Pylaiella littoralis]
MRITFPDPPPPSPKVPCPKCNRLFFNNQGLGVHVKTDHKDDVRIGVTRWCSTTRNVVDPSSTLPWSGVPSGRCWHVQFNHQASGPATPAGSVTFVLRPKRNGVGEDNMVTDGFPATEEEAPKKTRGAEHRRQYDVREKVSVVEQLRELESRAQEVRAHFIATPLQYLADITGISAPNISKWQRDEAKYVAAAADSVKKKLFDTTSRPKRWFPEAEKALYKMYRERRKKKVRVSTRWLTVTFKKLLAEKYPDDPRAKTFRASHRFAQKWAKRHSLSMRRKSNSKNKSLEERLPKIKVWHKRYRELLREPRRCGGQMVPWPQQAPEEGSGEPSQELQALQAHRKWGRFLLEERVNTDQVPVGFVNGQDSSWDQRGAKRVHVMQPFPG